MSMLLAMNENLTEEQFINLVKLKHEGTMGCINAMGEGMERLSKECGPDAAIRYMQDCMPIIFMMMF